MLRYSCQYFQRGLSFCTHPLRAKIQGRYHDLPAKQDLHEDGINGGLNVSEYHLGMCMRRVGQWEGQNIRGAELVTCTLLFVICITLRID